MKFDCAIIVSKLVVWLLLLILPLCSHGFGYGRFPSWRSANGLTRLQSKRTNVPLHLFTPKSPLIGKIVSVDRAAAGGDNFKGEVCTVVIRHDGRMPYWEGQCFGVIPPGVDKKSGKPFVNRLYSIASTRRGDDGKNITATLSVRRSLPGVCSNFLCDAKPGDSVMLTGPTGEAMLLPEQALIEKDVIMIATGTGIAPFRAFLRRLFVERPSGDMPAFKGLAWLIAGFTTKNSVLFADEFRLLEESVPSSKLRISLALSREEKNRQGGKMYVQDRVEQHSAELFDRLERGALVYFCGLRGMMKPLLAVLQRECERRGGVWSETLKRWKGRGQWHVEVY